MSSVSERARRAVTAALLAAAVGRALAQPTAPPPADRTVASPLAVPAKSTVGPIPGTDNRRPSTDNPLRGEDGVLHDGRRLFVLMNCSGCHGGRAGGGMGPSLRDEAWLYGGSDAQIFDSIAQGRSNGMPAWGTQLPEREIWKLVAYIRSLRTRQEPDAPQN